MIFEYFETAVGGYQRKISGGAALCVIEKYSLIGLGIERVTHLLSRDRGFTAHKFPQLNRTTIDYRWT